MTAVRGIFFALIVIVCVRPQAGAAQEVSINKTEAKDIASRVTGYVIWTSSRSDLMAVSLPTLSETLVRRTAKLDADYHPTIHAISGPDEKGRIAYIEDHVFVPDGKKEKHLLKTVEVDGTNDAEVFSRPGSALWATSRAGRGEIGTYLALAPSGGKAAFVSGLSEKQMPRALLYEGNLEIWDLENKVRHEVTTKALNEPLSWFPDGKRLAYVKLMPRAEVPKEAPGLSEFGKYFGEVWEELPAIYVLDVETRKSSFLHIGWSPVVASDGNSILVGGWNLHSKFSWTVLDFQSRSSRPVNWPGDAGGAIAFLPHNMVLYKGLPTAGAQISDRVTTADSRPAITLKVALIDSERFQTVVPVIDPRYPASFGRVVKRAGRMP